MPAVCSKLSFLTKKEAKIALAVIQRRAQHSSWRNEYRFYRCPNCKTYHLSSHES